MPANVFQITIAATDKASVVAQKVAQSFKKVVFPAQVAGKAVAMVGKDADFRRAATGLRSIAREAVGVVDNVSLASTALRGAVGLAGAGAFVASAKEWSASAAGAARFAQTIGMSSQRLQTFVGVGETFGIEAQATTGAVKTLGNTLEDALYGRNQDAMVMMNRLGIGLHRTKDGAVDASIALGDVADAIEKNKGNAQAQQRIAAIFGVSELLPMLRNGRKGLTEYQKQLKKTGAIRTPEMEANADRLQKSFVLAGKTLDGIGNRLENWIAPSLTKVLDGFSSLAQQHPQAAAGAVGAGSIAGTAIAAYGGVKAVSWMGRIVKGLVQVGKTSAAVSGETSAAGQSISALARGSSVAGEAIGAEGLAGAAEGAGIALGGIPIAAAVVGLAALGAAAYGSYKLIKQLREEHKKLSDNLPHRDLQASSETKFRIATAVSAIPFVGLAAQPFAAMYAGHVRQLSKAEKAAQARAFRFFVAEGWSAAQASGIVANLDRESGMDAKAVGDGGRAFGLAQWHPDRAAAFAHWAGHGIKNSTEQEQLAFVQYELTQGQEKRAGDDLRRTGTAAQAGAVVSQLYERPADASGQAAARAASASKIEVEFKNAPRGTRVTTTKPGANPPAVKVAHAMPEAVL